MKYIIWLEKLLIIIYVYTLESPIKDRRIRRHVRASSMQLWIEKNGVLRIIQRQWGKETISNSNMDDGHEDDAVKIGEYIVKMTIYIVWSTYFKDHLY